MKLIIVLSLLVLCACNNNPGNTATPGTITDTATTTLLTSKLRPGEKLVLHKTYTDTLSFVEFNDEGDNYLCIVEKNKDTIGLIYDSEYNFVRGDQVAINWRMDSIRYAGDSEFLDYTAFLISAKLIQPLTLTDKNISFLSRVKQYDETVKDTVNTISLNEAYSKTITEPEKAALAYVATFIGNECNWDGTANADRSNLKCKILTALDLGYQCSEKHLGFLRYWFNKDNTVLPELQNCPTIPDGATVQSTFDKINIATRGNDILVTFTVQSINVREGKSWTWTETDQFRFDRNNIRLIKKDRSPAKEETFTISGN
jgi:hypothetical protein